MGRLDDEDDGSHYRKDAYPRYQMKINDELKWCCLSEAGEWFDSGFNRVEIGSFVLEKAGEHPRPMNDDDRRKIEKAADAYSDDK